MSAPRKITWGHHIQFSSYINRLCEGAAWSKYGSRIACTDRFLCHCHRGWTGMLGAPPLVISFAQLESTCVAASVAGGLICISQIGYGIAAFGVGALENAAGAHLSTV